MSKDRIEKIIDIKVNADASIDVTAKMEATLEGIIKQVEKLKKSFNDPRMDAGWANGALSKLGDSLGPILKDVELLRSRIASIGNVKLEATFKQLEPLVAELDKIKSLPHNVGDDFSRIGDELAKALKSAEGIKDALKDVNVEASVSIDGAGAGAGNKSSALTAEKLLETENKLTEAIAAQGATSQTTAKAMTNFMAANSAAGGSVVGMYNDIDTLDGVLKTAKSETESLERAILEYGDALDKVTEGTITNNKAVDAESVSIKELLQTVGLVKNILASLEGKTLEEILAIPDTEQNSVTKLVYAYENLNNKIKALNEHPADFGTEAQVKAVNAAIDTIKGRLNQVVSGGLIEAIKKQLIVATDVDSMVQEQLDNIEHIQKAYTDGSLRTYKEYTAAVRNLTNATLVLSVKDLTAEQQKQLEVAQNLSAEMKRELQYANNLTNGYGALTQTMQGLSGIATSLIGSLQAFTGIATLAGKSNKSIQETIQYFVALQSVINGLQSFTKLDKVMKTFVTTLKHLHKSISVTYKSLLAETQASVLNTAATKAKTKAHQEASKAENGETKSLNALTKAEGAETVAAGVASTALGGLRKAVAYVTASLKKLFATIMANPVTAAIAGLTALAVAIKAISDKSREAKKELAEFNKTVSDLTRITADNFIDTQKLIDSWNQLGKDKNRKEIFEEYISALNSMGIKASTLADVEKVLNGELTGNFKAWRQEQEILDKQVEVFKRVTEAEQKYQEALTNASVIKNKKDKNAFLQPFEDELKAARAAADELKTLYPNLTWNQAENDRMRAEINEQMTPTGGGKSKEELRPLPYTTSGEWKDFINTCVKLFGPDWLKTPAGAAAQEKYASYLVKESEDAYQHFNLDRAGLDKAYREQIKLSLPKVDLKSDELEKSAMEKLDKVLDDQSKAIEEMFKEGVPGDSEYIDSIIDETQKYCDGIVFALAEAYETLWEQSIHHMDSFSTIMDNLSNGLDSYVDSIMSVAEAELEAGKISDAQYRKKEKQMKDLQKLSQAAAVVQVVSSTAAGLGSI